VNTIAIIAAAAERPYTVPFSGPVSAVYAGEVASAFFVAISQERDGAKVFDFNGRASSVAEWLEVIRRLAPGAQLQVAGEAVPFPADLSDQPVQNYLGDYGPVPLEEGIAETLEAFRRLLAAGALSPDAVG
jgi:nucleoside-diphosphate-sugar epimerase